MSDATPDLSAGVGILVAMSGGIPPGLYEIAWCQAGVISRRQALGSGLSAGAIVAKIRYERWRQVYRGVYTTFTGPPSREAQLWAAVLYAGTGARLSHETAAELHGLADVPSPLIHVTVPASRRVRPTKDVLIHVSARLDERPRFPRGILPRTLIEATVLDLVDAAPSADDARGWVTRACERGLTSEVRLRAAMSGRGRLRWRHQLAEIVAARQAA